MHLLDFYPCLLTNRASGFESKTTLMRLCACLTATPSKDKITDIPIETMKFFERCIP